MLEAAEAGGWVWSNRTRGLYSEGATQSGKAVEQGSDATNVTLETRV